MKGFISGAVLAGCAILAGTSCSRSSVSDLKHEVNGNLDRQSTWNWVELKTDEDIDQKFLPFLLSMTGERTFSRAPSDFATTIRLQEWVDAIDKVARRETPGWDQIPSPKLVLKADVNPNAHASGYVRCLVAPVVWNTSLPVVPTASLISYAEGGVTAVDEDLGCTDEVLTPVQMQSFAEWAGGADGHCDFTYNEAEKRLELDLSGNCRVSPEMESIGGANRIAFFATSNVLVVHSGLITSFSEETVAAVIAHELGHYYRSHITEVF